MVKAVLCQLGVHGGKCLAALAYCFAVLAANSACTLFYYEPEQPEALNRLKKH